MGQGLPRQQQESWQARLGLGREGQLLFALSITAWVWNSVRRLKRLGYQVILARGATRNAADRARYIETR